MHPHAAELAELLDPLRFDQWIEFIALHEARHTAQLRAAAVALG